MERGRPRTPPLHPRPLSAPRARERCQLARRTRYHAPMSSGVRDLRVWQESVALAGDVIRAVRQRVRRETKSVSDAPMSSALAVATHVAEGYGRTTPADQRESYHLA